MPRLDGSPAPRDGAPGRLAGRCRALVLAVALVAAVAACRGDASRSALAEAADRAPEPPRPETAWVSLASFGNDTGPRVRRRSFRSTGQGFRVIVELRDPTTVMSPGRLVANILSPATTLPIRTLETRIAPKMEVRADTVFVDAPPGDYTILVLHDYGVESWSIAAQEAGEVTMTPRVPRDSQEVVR